MKIRIYYEDTDAGGIVYHSRYLNFCERARSEFFFSAGEKPFVGNCHFAIKHIEADFLKYAILGDMLEIHTKIVELKNASVIIEHKITRDDDLIYTMRVKLVFLCTDGKIAKIPKVTKDFFIKFMG
jgi:acyl-CoA thioester hydrolase